MEQTLMHTTDDALLFHVQFHGQKNVHKLKLSDGTGDSDPIYLVPKVVDGEPVISLDPGPNCLSEDG